jgi:hypothetical protein
MDDDGNKRVKKKLRKTCLAEVECGQNKFQ